MFGKNAAGMRSNNGGYSNYDNDGMDANMNNYGCPPCNGYADRGSCPPCNGCADCGMGNRNFPRRYYGDRNNSNAPRYNKGEFLNNNKGGNFNNRMNNNRNDNGGRITMNNDNFPPKFINDRRYSSEMEPTNRNSRDNSGNRYPNKPKRLPRNQNNDMGTNDNFPFKNYDYQPQNNNNWCAPCDPNAFNFCTCPACSFCARYQSGKKTYYKYPKKQHKPSRARNMNY